MAVQLQKKPEAQALRETLARKLNCVVTQVVYEDPDKLTESERYMHNMLRYMIRTLEDVGVRFALEYSRLDLDYPEVRI